MMLPTVELRYRKGNCEKNPLTLIFEPPLLGYDLHLIELPERIRNDIMKDLDLLVSEQYFTEIKVKNYSFYK